MLIKVSIIITNALQIKRKIYLKNTINKLQNII